MSDTDNNQPPAPPAPSQPPSQPPSQSAVQKPAQSAGNLFVVLPLRNIVVFPGMVVPLLVGREKSVRALEEVAKGNKNVLLVTQKDSEANDPVPADLYKVATIGKVRQSLNLPDGTVKVMVEGMRRVAITEYIAQAGQDFLTARATPLAASIKAGTENDIDSLRRSVVSQFGNYVKLNRKIPSDVQDSIDKIDNATRLADTIAAHLNISIDEKQKLLEVTSVLKRLELVLGHMDGEVGIMEVEKKIRGRVKTQMEKTQREYYLNEQMKAIQKELGDGDDGAGELHELETRIKEAKMSKEAKEKADSEMKKLKSMSPMSAEATVVRNYLDWLLAVPWKKKSRIKKDLTQAEKVLDADHYGLEKVKERILEYLAVQQRSKKLRGPILCLVGPPGVGKTSLGKSLAKATGREFIRMSLGGIRDESEIRGHRRTYIGSMPGKIIQSMKKVKSVNPLILLDEIDKLGADHRGDPSAALLEVLDPEQNDSFADHYMEVDYDLSNVMFITTANSLNIAGPLLDRMEIIRIAGYTEDEKLEIAKQHLLPQIKEEHALRRGEFAIDDESLRDLIRCYTRESGVRNLKRELATLARKAITQIIKGEKTQMQITTDNLADYAGIKKFRFGLAEEEDQVGAVTGLAWTEVGGELLTIEGVMVTGKGKMITTGKLGDVMKESIGAASSYVRSRAAAFGIEPPLFERKDIHVHVPEGATPKDGPSAGVGMATAIVSLMTGIPVRKEIAMTGEVTLRGRVLPIGGLKEKLLAALRGGITEVLIPAENEKDLADVPDNIKEGMAIIPVENMDEVLRHALVRPPQAIEWDEEAYLASQKLAGNVGTPTSQTH
ncbi:MAG: endopeptidase La [Alphaproteobacteria bacterium]|nr:endopeptidase La [Alphaproteobacteria bacterium]MBE8221003.1 endopeptidase La [Alphaproteobacteria bacterium]